MLTKYGISSEFEPIQLYHKAQGNDPLSEKALSDLTGTWNIQADASLSHLMDFSDYYVLPDSPLADFWKMSEEALINAFTCERPQIKESLFKCPQLLERIFGTDDQEMAKQNLKEKIEELSL